MDLESLKFSKAKRECVFLILEQSQNASGSTTLLQKRRLQSSAVTVRNVAGVRISGAQGEVELYIEDVRTTQSCLCMKCINGVVELCGEDLEVCIEEVTAGASGDVEVRLATPIGDISWRKKQRKAKP
jgi:hypothetical protein